MFAKSTFARIDTAFGILFVLLLAVLALHIGTVSDMSSGHSSGASQIQMAADLEQFRALDRDLRCCLDHLRGDDVDERSKASVLNRELENIESVLRELATSRTGILGQTRLVEPYNQIREVRRKIQTGAENVNALLAPGGQTERALEATLYVVRNNITRLGEEQSAAMASLYGFGNRARRFALFGSLAAILVFGPVRFLAGRAAAKPIRNLRKATNAVAEERWHASYIEDMSNDAVGELVVAFNSMAAKLYESRMARANSFRRTLESLVEAIEAKDPYVSDHSCNVSRFAELLARASGVPELEVREVACAGLLHDIGKIGISEQIINKPGKLTAEEFSIIEKHPVTSDRIIAPLDGADKLVPSVRHHHEHWDGTGYPDRLAGNDIPLTARIVAVADVFDALISDRPYRAKMPLEDAVSVLIAEAGRTLDPTLVDKFISEVIPKVRTQIEKRVGEESKTDHPTSIPSSTTTS